MLLTFECVGPEPIYGSNIVINNKKSVTYHNCVAQCRRSGPKLAGGPSISCDKTIDVRRVLHRVYSRADTSKSAKSEM
jgi:hypothetical protein